MKERFKVSGMSCAACVSHVKKAVEKVDGVSEARVNLLTNSMEVEFNNKECIDRINKAVANAGYKSEVYKEEKPSSNKLLIIRLVSSLVLLVPLFYLSMGHMLGWNIGIFERHLMTLGVILMLLALSMMIINNKFFRNGFKGIIHLAPNMDSLVMLASLIAFIYSSVMLILMGIYPEDRMRYSMNLVYETSGMVPTLITIGKLLEAISKGKTTNALKTLERLEPAEATVIREGAEVKINPKEMALDDIFIVKPGELFAADGVVVEGYTNANESSLTGEAIPVLKNIGDSVYSSTINLDGLVKVKATSVGSDTTLSKIIKMVEDASQSKAPIEKIADRVSGIFVPVIMIISLIVFAFWMMLGGGFVKNHTDSMLLTYSLERAISVLVIACPCALGLATPVAVMVGNGVAAKMGILFKNAEALENLAGVKIAALDKTGTITTGEMSADDIISYDDNALLYAASLEIKSNHPIAKAICAAYSGDKLDVSDYREIPGAGVIGVINGKEIRCLSLKEAIKYIDINQDIIDAASSKGASIVCVTEDDKLLGILSVSDTIKPDSKNAIMELKRLGITPIMLTGDNESSASHIAKEAGLDYYISSLMPDEKLEIISKLKQQATLMMIGDGINDSPALTKADIGVAIGSGADIAIDSADVILMKSSLMDAASAVKVSKSTKLNIMENLFWAFIYNLIMIPIAAGALSFIGLYKIRPWYGALAMSLSSVCVVINALRLNLFNPNKSRKSKDCIKLDLNNINGGDNMNMLVINVDGMMCPKCKAHVEAACMKVSGVKSAEADLEKKCVVVMSDFPVDANQIKENIKEAGYEVK